ncbi:hypothetical protein [Flavobacterium sp. NKUCC04_CG]|uniref:hypothetical protein n=1 Tax=Flavobacterium sp. NKUCC04_CG TaxID=2842121 RepID=UPI00351D1490
MDPLAEQFPGWTPYHYVHNNPINLIDPTGMSAEESDGHYYGSDGKTYLGTDGINDNKSYTLKDGKSPNFKNQDVNWGGKLDSKHSNELKKNSVEGVFDKSKVDTRVSTIQRTGPGFDFSNADSDIKNALMYDLPQGLQNVGDGIAVAGFGLTLTGVGAEIGVPLAGAGNLISGIGSGIEIGVDLFEGNMKGAGINIGFYLGSKFLEKGLNKALPGAGKSFGEKGFNLGTEILTQGASLKATGAQRVINEQNKK